MKKIGISDDLWLKLLDLSAQLGKVKCIEEAIEFLYEEYKNGYKLSEAIEFLSEAIEFLYEEYKNGYKLSEAIEFLYEEFKRNQGKIE